MLELKDGKLYLLVEHWRYLNPVKDAPRKLLKQIKPNIYYVYES